MTLDIFEFMARMLYFLPEQHSKQIRWASAPTECAKSSRVLRKNTCDNKTHRIRLKLPVFIEKKHPSSGSAERVKKTSAAC